MNQKFKKMRNVTKIILLTIIVVFGTSGCGSRYYRGDYPELFTVALNSLLGVVGVAPNLIDDPRIVVLEEDNHGRILFMYEEGRGLGISILISQKSDGKNVYFYPHYNFIIFKTFEEMTFRVTRDGLQMNHLYPEIIAQIDGLKKRNDWNQELNLEKSIRKEIDVYNNFNRKGPVKDSTLLELYDLALGDDAWENPLKFYVNLLTTDVYGRSVYLGTGGEWDNQRHVMMFFQPDGSFDEVKGVMEWVDTHTYQTALREFKELNGWNQPFEGEGSTGMPLWWIIAGVVFVIGASGFVGARLYLQRRGEVESKKWLLIKNDENLGQCIIALGSKPIHALNVGLRKVFSIFPIGKGKRRFFSLLYLVMPSLFVNGLFFYFFVLPSFLVIPSWYSILLLYLITVVGIVLFFRFRPCEFNMLILGLSLSPLGIIIYVVVMMVATLPFPFFLVGLPLFIIVIIAPMLLYSLPFIGISFLIKRFNKMDG